MNRRRNAVRRWESVHKLVWTLEGCLRERAVGEARLGELRQFFAALAAAGGDKGGGGGGRKRRRHAEDEESIQRGSAGA